mmetsp:Transcript_31348/g.63619  ORF Transcript_31348/g.63619 Transcript_31348/m.63619 type:complete len:201 (-) Transcript_31348:2473-3075(-)
MGGAAITVECASVPPRFSISDMRRLPRFDIRVLFRTDPAPTMLCRLVDMRELWRRSEAAEDSPSLSDLPGDMGPPDRGDSGFSEVVPSAFTVKVSEEEGMGVPRGVVAALEGGGKPNSTVMADTASRRCLSFSAAALSATPLASCFNFRSCSRCRNGLSSSPSNASGSLALSSSSCSATFSSASLIACATASGSALLFVL